MENMMLKPDEIFNESVNSGIKKGNMSISKLIINGIFGGAFIAFGGAASSAASNSIENYSLQKLVSGLVFPVGLILIIICGAELFTGNSLMIAAYKERKITLKQLLKNWIIVYLSNFTGAFFIALFLYLSGFFDGNSGKFGAQVIKIASAKCSISFSKAFFSGILCNMLVCLAVWGSTGAKDIKSKIAIIWFPIMTFIVSGFEHSVANMYYFSAGLLCKNNEAYVNAANIGNKIVGLNFKGIWHNLLPVTLGNIVGGGLIIALGYWFIFGNKKEKIENVKSI